MDDLRHINELIKFDVVSSVERILYEQIIWDDAAAEVTAAYAEIDESIKILFDENAKKSTVDQEWLESSKAKIKTPLSRPVISAEQKHMGASDVTRRPVASSSGTRSSQSISTTDGLPIHVASDCEASADP